MIRQRLLLTAYALLALVIFVDLVPFLRGGFGWRWPYLLADAPRAVGFALLTVGYVLGAWFARRRAPFAQAWAFIGGVVLGVGAVWLRNPDPLYELFARTASGLTTGPHMAAAQLDWTRATLVDWPVIMRGYDGVSQHVALAPPGLPLLYRGVAALTPAPLADALHVVLLPYQCHNYALLSYTPAEWASAAFGMAMPVWAALAVFPLWGVGKRLGYPPNEAVLLWPLVPGAIAFAGTFNTLYPALALTALWAFTFRWPGGYVAAGFICGTLTFANFSIVPLAAFFGFYALLTCRPFGAAVRAGVWFGVGFFAPWIAYAALGGPAPWTLLRTAFDIHLELDRPYLPWLWLHTWDFAIFAGLPLIVLSLWAAFKRDAVALALWLTLAAVVVSGTGRGETGRVWLFFAPFALTAVTQRNWRTTVVAHALLTAVMLVGWDVIGTDLTPPPALPQTAPASTPATVDFGGEFALVGWEVDAETEAIVLRLDWRAAERLTTPYWFAGLLVGPEGAPVGETVVWQPNATNFPATCWPPGVRVGDEIALPLPADAPPGDYYISLAAFADENNPADRIAVDGTDSQVGLGPITVR